MSCRMAHQRLWDFAAVYVTEICTCTAHPIFDLKGRTHLKIVTGEKPDITEWLEHDFYQPIWYFEAGQFPQQKRLMGRWLGVSHRVGQAL